VVVTAGAAVVVVTAGVAMEVRAALLQPVSMVISKIMTRIKGMVPDNLVFKFNSNSKSMDKVQKCSGANSNLAWQPPFSGQKYPRAVHVRRKRR
jgi:hypothetical protein